MGFWSSTGIAGDVVDMKTATEAGVGGVTGFARAAGWAAGETMALVVGWAVGKGMKAPSSQKSESRSPAGLGATTGWVMRWLKSFA